MFTENTLLFAATIVGIYFTSITIFNTIYLRSTRKTALRKNGSLVSVILPARNEENNIGPCLDCLLKQSYLNLEIIVVDDNSEDRTYAIASQYALDYQQVTLVKGKPMPRGWNGKQFACHQAVMKAKGELLFMTDADVRHGTDSIAFAVGNLLRKQAGFLSGYLRQELGSFGESLIVPMTYIMTSLLLPLPILTSRGLSLWGFGIGQYILIRKEALIAIGGYKRIKDSLVEDMAMARAMKTTGYKSIFVDAQEVASCRMYNNYNSAFKGFAKCVLGAVGGRAWVVGLISVVIALLVIVPFLLLIGGLLTGSPNVSSRIVPVLLFSGMWSLTLLDRGIRQFYSFFYPLAFINIVFIGFVSIFRTGYGSGIEWKGRLVRCGNSDLPDPEIINTLTVFKVFSFIVYYLVLLLVFIFNKTVFGLKVKGRKNLKGINGGFFLISNHSLYLDPAIVANAIFPKRTYFSAMEETFKQPVLGGFIRLLGAFPLPVGAGCIRRIIPAIDWALNRGKCIHFFPEGKLYHYNRKPAEFNEGVFYLANRFSVPIVPITLVVHPRQIFRWKLPKPFIKITVMIDNPLYPSEFNLEQNKRESVRAMTIKARERITHTIIEKSY